MKATLILFLKRKMTTVIHVQMSCVSSGLIVGTVIVANDMKYLVVVVKYLCKFMCNLPTELLSLRVARYENIYNGHMEQRNRRLPTSLKTRSSFVYPVIVLPSVTTP